MRAFLRAGLIAILAGACGAAALAQEDAPAKVLFGRMAQPADLASRSIGSYARGWTLDRMPAVDDAHVAEKARVENGVDRRTVVRAAVGEASHADAVARWGRAHGRDHRRRLVPRPGPLDACVRRA